MRKNQVSKFAPCTDFICQILFWWILVGFLAVHSRTAKNAAKTFCPCCNIPRSTARTRAFAPELEPLLRWQLPIFVKISTRKRTFSPWSSQCQCKCLNCLHRHMIYVCNNLHFGLTFWKIRLLGVCWHVQRITGQNPWLWQYHAAISGG